MTNFVKGLRDIQERNEKGPEGKPKKAMDNEWNKLIERECFDFKEYFESKELTALARAGL